MPKVSKKLVVQEAVQNLAAQLLTPEYLEKWPHARVMGYARVSTEEQVLDVQIDKLIAAGVKEEDLFSDKMSGGNAHRDGFRLMRKQIQSGDFLLVCSVSRIWRDAKMLLTVIDELGAQSIKVRSLSEHLDPYTASGRFQITVMAASDELERGHARERTRDAMQLKIREGMFMGAPRKVTDEVAAKIRKMRKEKVAVKDIAIALKLSKSAVYGAL